MRGTRNRSSNLVVLLLASGLGLWLGLRAPALSPVIPQRTTVAASPGLTAQTPLPLAPPGLGTSA